MPEPKFEIPFHKRFRHAVKRPHFEAMATKPKRETLLGPTPHGRFEWPRVHMDWIVTAEQQERIARERRRRLGHHQRMMREMDVFQPVFEVVEDGPQQDFRSITEGVSREYRSMFGDTKPERYAEHARRELAARTGCEAIGDKSCYAVMVGVPKTMPDVVVKVCTSGDAFIDYAKACHDGSLTGPHFLKVYSTAEVQPGVWVFVTERLWYKLSVKEHEDLELHSFLCKQNAIQRAVADVYEKVGGGLDCHRGNIMKRRDGTVVLLDPVC